MPVAAPRARPRARHVPCTVRLSHGRGHGSVLGTGSCSRSPGLTHLRSAAPYRPSTREGQVEEGVSVAAPRGDMDESRSRVTSRRAVEDSGPLAGGLQSGDTPAVANSYASLLAFYLHLGHPRSNCRPDPLPSPPRPAPSPYTPLHTSKVTTSDGPQTEQRLRTAGPKSRGVGQHRDHTSSGDRDPSPGRGRMATGTGPDQPRTEAAG